MDAGEIAGLIAAGAFLMLVIVLAVPILKLGRTVDAATRAITDLTVRNVDCATGKQVLRTWVRRSHFGTTGPPRLLAFGSWRCRFTIIPTMDNPYGRITCVASRERFVRFYGYS